MNPGGPNQHYQYQRLSPIVEEPKRGRTMIWLKLGAALLVVLVGWLVFETTGGGANPADRRPVEDQVKKVVRAEAERIELTIPSRWAELPASYRNEDAVLQYGQIFQERYVMVIVDDKADFTHFDMFEDAVLTNVGDLLPEGAVGLPEHLTINDSPAVRYEVDAKVDGQNATFWYTLVDGKNGYYQLIGWTLTDRKQESGPALFEVFTTFTEL